MLSRFSQRMIKKKLTYAVITTETPMSPRLLQRMTNKQHAYIAKITKSTFLYDHNCGFIDDGA